MPLSKTRSVLQLWSLALAISVGLAAAGLRWPEPLEPRGEVIALLLVGPPLLMALWLLGRWRLHPVVTPGKGAHPDRGESTD